MATEAQIAANRRNAQLSTGPRTAQGKFFSSRNRLSHGLRSSRLILPNENPADFEELASTLGDRPVAIAKWKFDRANRAEFEALLSPEPDINRLLLLSTYRIRLERAFFKLASNAT